jgi:hypothetical protein
VPLSHRDWFWELKEQLSEFMGREKIKLYYDWPLPSLAHLTFFMNTGGFTYRINF